MKKKKMPREFFFQVFSILARVVFAFFSFAFWVAFDVEVQFAWFNPPT